jgi:hypothetical protein
MSRPNEGAVTIIHDHEHDEPEERQTEADAALEDFMDKARKIGATAKIIINKQSGGTNSSETFCGQYPVDKYDYFDLLELIQSTWGAGDYRLYCTMKGRRGILQNQLITVGAAPNQLNNLNGSDNTTNTLLRMMQDRDQKFLDGLKPKEGEDDDEKMIRKMLMYKQLFSSNESKSSSGLGGLKDAIEMIGLIKGLSLGGGGGEESGMGAMVIKALESLGPVAMAALQKAQPPQVIYAPQPQRALPNIAPAPATEPKPEKPIVSEANKDQAKQMVAQLLTLLDTVGVSLLQPDSIAEKLLDGATDEQLVLIAEWVSAEDAYKQMVDIDSRIEKYARGVPDLIEHIRGQLGYPSKYADEYVDEESPIEHVNAVAVTETPVDTVAELDNTQPHEA